MDMIISDIMEWCQNDMEYLQELIQELQNIVDNNNNDDEKRQCSECKKEIKKGFCMNDGLEYYCSEKCLCKHYTKEEYNKMYENNEAYYTEWEG